MPFTMSYGVPPAEPAKTTPKAKTAKVAKTTVGGSTSRRDALKSKAEQLFTSAPAATGEV